MYSELSHTLNKDYCVKGIERTRLIYTNEKWLVITTKAQKCNT